MMCDRLLAIIMRNDDGRSRRRGRMPPPQRKNSLENMDPLNGQPISLIS
jgi:hypothetical protein